MKIKNIFYILVIIIFVFLCFFFIFGHPMSKRTSDVQTNKIQYVKIAEKILKVDLATTPQEQEQGLSGRNKLNKDEGMLFVFNQPDKYAFWMKDMNFPIDIIWLNNDMHIVYIKENAKPESYLPTGKAGPETFTPDEDARYVLEVISSFSEKNNLKIGDKVEFLSS